MSSSTLQFRIDHLERRLVVTAAERNGEPVSDLIRRAIRREIEAPAGGRLNLLISPRLAAELLNKAAQLGTSSATVVEALIRDHLDAVTEARLDPESRIEWAKRRAREILNA